MYWHNLPEEMRKRKQWVCANDRREPRRWDNYDLAEVDNPNTWGTFEQVTRAAIWNGCDIGYVLTEDDDLTIIDLDDKPYNPASPEMRMVHADIVARADTYIERSVGGYGYHIVVRGKPEFPIKTPHVEMYGSLRMMVCTGRVIKPMQPAEGAELISLIAHHFGRAHQDLDNVDNLPDWAEGQPILDDAEVIAKCQNAENGDKFTSLFFAGDLSAYRNDHSAGDSALLNMLCFFTPHNEQVRRIFKTSELYRPNQRNRQDRYMNYSILKWRCENAPIDLSQLKFPTIQRDDGRTFDRYGSGEISRTESATIAHDLVGRVQPIQSSIETEQEDGNSFQSQHGKNIDNLESIEQPRVQAGTDDLAYPPGLIGEIAQFAFNASYRPIKEGAIPAAITYMAGLIGRAYHIDGAGLNQYMIFLAESGDGKEGAKKAIRLINGQLALRIPSTHTAISSGDYSSGVALVKELSAAPSTLAMLGEVGEGFKIMLDPRAPSHIRELKKAMTEAWSESGPSGFMNPRRYSDKIKNVEGVRSPALSLLGESVPDTFYDALSIDVTNDGFLPRWWVFDYKGGRPDPNYNRLKQVPADLIQRICDVFVAAKAVQDQGQAMEVVATSEAQQILRAFEVATDTQIRNQPKGSPAKAILNRTYEKARRLAALFAACENPYKPTITPRLAGHAIDMVRQCDSNMLSKFKDGTIAAGGREAETEFSEIIRAAIAKYIEMTPNQRSDAKCPKKLLDVAVIPMSYLKDYLKRRNAFKRHPLGCDRAIAMGINQAIDEGLLVQLGALDKHKLGVNQKLFSVGADFEF